MCDLAVFILAGGPYRSDVSVSVERALYALPLASNASLLDGWCRSLAGPALGLDAVRLDSVTVISSADQAFSPSVSGGGVGSRLRLVRESRQHRGTAGVVADQLREKSDRADGMVLVVEASASPVVDLGPMLALASRASAGSRTSILGQSELGRYCGVCLCDQESFTLVPDVGFFDLKEQFLPQLRSAGGAINAVTIAPRALRLRSRREWLAIVEAWAQCAFGVGEGGMGDSESTSPPEHREDGVCVIEPGAVIREAVISSSIIMAGAVVESGAIVARSVIGPGAVIAAGSVVVDAVVPARGRVDSNRMRVSDPAGLRLPRGIANMGGG
jgi:hypothetical protein